MQWLADWFSFLVRSWGSASEPDTTPVPEDSPTTTEDGTVSKYSLRDGVLGAAIVEADHGIHEGKEEDRQRVLRYLKNCTPPISVRAPWCAAFVQYLTDIVAHARGKKNPFDAVMQEALVQSYFNWGTEKGLVLPRGAVSPGDLVLFQFNGSKTWNHIGFVLEGPRNGRFRSIEGNTSPGVGATDEERERNGGGVWLKDRRTDASYPVTFLRFPADPQIHGGMI